MGKLETNKKVKKNAAQGKDFIEGTDYEMAEDGFSVRIPYAPITK